MSSLLPDTRRQIRRLAYLFLLLFLLLAANLTYLQLIAAPAVTAQPGNSRYLMAQLRIPEGRILSADGKVLAASVLRPGSRRFYRRVYPQGALAAHITGFVSLKYGRMGLEKTYSSELTAQPPVLSWDDYLEQAKGVVRPGHTLVTTLDMRLQRRAFAELGRRRGAIVVMRPATGDVVALASYPSFDPSTVHRLWPRLRRDPASPLVDRATSGLYPPGSVFKLVTVSGALDAKVATPDSVYNGPPELEVYGGKVTNYADEGRGTMPLSDALAYSVNTIFAQVGLKLGGSRLVDYAERFGFNQDVPFDLASAQSIIPSADRMDKLEVAWSAVGQARDLVTPLEVAMIGSGIANHGTIMRPRIVRQVRDWRGVPLREVKPEPWLKPVSAGAALQVTDMMIGVVDRGTGTAAQIDGVEVAGKTGTAEPGRGETHAWVVSFAPAHDPEYGVAVVIEHGGLGGAAAAPVAHNMMMAALRPVD